MSESMRSTLGLIQSDGLASLLSMTISLLLILSVLRLTNCLPLSLLLIALAMEYKGRHLI